MVTFVFREKTTDKSSIIILLVRTQVLQLWVTSRQYGSVETCNCQRPVVRSEVAAQILAISSDGESEQVSELHMSPFFSPDWASHFWIELRTSRAQDDHTISYIHNPFKTSCNTMGPSTNKDHQCKETTETTVKILGVHYPLESLE